MEMPNINIENDKIVQDINEVPILINNEQKVVKMTKISSGERREIMKRHIKTNITNDGNKGEITDIMGIQIATLNKVIIEAPFKTDEKSLMELPDEVIDYLYSQYSDWTKKKTIVD